MIPSDRRESGADAEFKLRGVTRNNILDRIGGVGSAVHSADVMHRAFGVTWTRDVREGGEASFHLIWPPHAKQNELLPKPKWVNVKNGPDRNQSDHHRALRKKRTMGGGGEREFNAMPNDLRPHTHTHTHRRPD